MIVDLSKIPTPQLKEIKNILEYGATARAETDKALRQLQAENERLKKLNYRRDAVESAGLEWDEEYFLSLNDKTFESSLEKLKSASATATRSMNIPQIFSHELSSMDTLRDGFAELRNRRNESA